MLKKVFWCNKFTDRADNSVLIDDHLQFVLPMMLQAAI